MFLPIENLLMRNIERGKRRKARII